MSAQELIIEDKKIIFGYDRRLDYVFMVIFNRENDEMLYSNLDLVDALDKIDFNFFVNIAKENFDLVIPVKNIDDVFLEVYYQNNKVEISQSDKQYFYDGLENHRKFAYDAILKLAINRKGL